MAEQKGKLNRKEARHILSRFISERSGIKLDDIKDDLVIFKAIGEDEFLRVMRWVERSSAVSNLSPHFPHLEHLTVDQVLTCFGEDT